MSTAPVTVAAADAVTAGAELWRNMPPLDDETVDALRRLLFPQRHRTEITRAK